MECNIEKLIMLVEQRPAIYDFKMKEHNSRTTVDKLWTEIAAEMEVSVADCKGKWTSLRNSFNRAVREGRDVRNSSSGSKRRKWYLMDAMEFLRDFVGVHRKFENNITDPRESDVSYPNQSIEDTEATIIENQPDELDNDSIYSSDKIPFYANRFENLTAAAKLVQFLQSRTKPSEPENPTLTFFKSLIPDIEKLTDSRRRKFKQAVLSELYRHLDEQEDI